jgi:hypothetical protein
MCVCVLFACIPIIFWSEDWAPPGKGVLGASTSEGSWVCLIAWCAAGRWESAVPPGHQQKWWQWQPARRACCCSCALAGAVGWEMVQGVWCEMCMCRRCEGGMGAVVQPCSSGGAISVMFFPSLHQVAVHAHVTSCCCVRYASAWTRVSVPFMGLFLISRLLLYLL